MFTRLPRSLPTFRLLTSRSDDLFYEDYVTPPELSEFLAMSAPISLDATRPTLSARGLREGSPVKIREISFRRKPLETLQAGGGVNL